MNTDARYSPAPKNVLIVSGCHLTKETLSALISSRFSVHIFKADQRYLLHLKNTELSGATQPADLRQITEYAQRNKCEWISFDDLAPLNPALPSYH